MLIRSTGLNLLLVAATIVFSSSAGAAEYQGHMLGEFVEAGEHGGRPYYRQRDTEGEDAFLYSERGSWLVSNTLGGSSANLRSSQNTIKPPVDRWMFSRGEYNDDDTSLTLEFTSLSPCQLVRVEGEGDVLKEQPDCLGDYRSVQTSAECQAQR